MMDHFFRTYEGSTDILVENVLNGRVIDTHLWLRTDLARAREQVGDVEALRLLGEGAVTPGGVIDHTGAARKAAGRAVNWTGEKTETGFVFVVAKGS